MPELVALGVQAGDAMGSYLGGKQAGLAEQRMKTQNRDSEMDMVRKQMGMIGSVALGSMGGKLDGEVDPALFEQGLDYLQGQGIDVAQYRGKPGIAKVAAQGSLDVLQTINLQKGDQALNLAMQKFQEDMEMSAREAAAKAEQTGYEREQDAIDNAREQQKVDASAKPENNTPDGFAVNADGTMSAIPGGPADPEYIARKKGSETGASAGLKTIDKKEIIDSDTQRLAARNTVSTMTQAMELNDKAYYGPGSGLAAKATGLFGNESGLATQTLGNVITGSALENLKATFGAAPTEGERKMLLEIQGSVNEPPQVRKEIYTRAIAFALAREDWTKRKATAIRDGSYYQEDFDAVPLDFSEFLPIARDIADNGKKTTPEKNGARMGSGQVTPVDDDVIDWNDL